MSMLLLGQLQLQQEAAKMNNSETKQFNSNSIQQSAVKTQQSLNECNVPHNINNQSTNNDKQNCDDNFEQQINNNSRRSRRQSIQIDNVEVSLAEFKIVAKKELSPAIDDIASRIGFG
jgi:hypothetical protein